MLQEFFAVTRTSLYHVRAKSEDGLPSAIKIALYGDSSILVGHKLMYSSQMIAVGNRIMGYIPEKYGATHPLVGIERDFHLINTRYWGESTSGVVALFTEKESAMQCFDEHSSEICDPRWIEDTRKVLDLIGDEHPVFFLPRDDWSLIAR